MRAPLAIFTALTLAACSGTATDDYPALVPAEQILAEPVLPAHASADPDAVSGELAAARGGLQAEVAQARAAPGAAPDLARRGADLRERAAAIRAEACAQDAAAGRPTANCP